LASKLWFLQYIGSKLVGDPNQNILLQRNEMEISTTSALCVFSYRVLKDHVLPTKPAVDCGESLQLVFSVVPLLRVQEDLKRASKEKDQKEHKGDHLM